VPQRIPLPVPFPEGTVNAWKLDDGSIVDCGVSTSKSWATLEPHLVGVERLLLTHGHVDHAGNSWRLAETMPVYAGVGEEENLETFRHDGPVRNQEFVTALQVHGMPEEPLAAIRASSDVVDKFTEDFKLTGTLANGASIGSAKVIATPGHTPGSSCYLVENDLITGDTLLERITSNAVELRDADKGRFYQYVETMRALDRFIDCTCLPGHHEPFPITAKSIDYHIDSHENRAKRIQSVLREPKTAWQVMRHVFPGLEGPGGWFMGMAEIVGHLHRLEILDEVSVSEKAGLRYFG
jgi:glyoxylase-like metal-dependent hydrolase (beta-lactamase superfamily II)